MRLRSLRRWAPPRLKALLSARALARTRSEFGAMTLRKSFEEVYSRRLWGSGQSTAPRSGEGSNSEFATAYAALVADVVHQQGSVHAVADLGCGDFSVGRHIRDLGIAYVGIDVVPAVIAENNKLYSGENVRFLCKDLAKDELPPAGLALLRQVLQHLSNEEIRQVLSACAIYPLILVTEHVPAGTGWTPNQDKPHGPDIRLYDGSGVDLQAPPFSVPARELHVLPYPGELGGVLRTVAIRGADLAREA